MVTSECKRRNCPSHPGIRCSATVMLAPTVNSAERSARSPSATSSSLHASDSTRRALWRQYRTRRAALQQGHAELALELLDGATRIRLRHARESGGSAEASVVV